MTQSDFKFDTKRWLLWGAIAILVLAGIVFFFVWLSGDGVDENEPTAEQVEWSIDVSEYGPTPGNVTLKGDEPLGFPTETWRGDVQLARTVSAKPFEWNMDVSPAVPVPVYDIDQASSCDELTDLLTEWANAVASGAGPARQAEASAFAQHAVNTMVEQGCELPTG